MLPMKTKMLSKLCAIFLLIQGLGSGAFGAVADVSQVRVVQSPDVPAPLGGDLIPSDRRIQWDPGVPGGIPVYPVGVNVKNSPYNAAGDGVTDDYSAVTNAIARCPNGSAVYFPPGNYLISKQLFIQDRRIVLRGAGPDQSRLIFTDTSSSVAGNIYFKGSAGSKFPVLGGYGKDSPTVNLASTSAFNPGDFVRLEQDNDPALLEGNIPDGIAGNTARFYICQYNQVVSKSSNTVTLRHPLYFSYNPAMNPRIQKIYMTTNCGVENLFLDQRGTRDAMVYFLQCAYSWVSGIESTNGNWDHIAFDSSFACEARSNFVHHAKTYGQGGYGIGLSSTTDCLVEDNILYYLRHGIVLQNGASGNVVAYNYSHRVFDAAYPRTDYLLSDIEHHGGHPYMNLVEGNVCAKLTMDDYWGSSRHNTLFRNNVQRYSDGLSNAIIYGMWAVQLDRSQLFENIVGNILCKPRDTGAVTTFGLSSYSNPYDSRVTNTLFWHGNFDYVSRTTKWDLSTPNHDLAASLYLNARPSYFGNLTWPPFGPGPSDDVPQVGTIPALQRWIARFGNP